LSTSTATPSTLSAEELAGIDAYWRAVNYLSVGQIYLLDNPLLREALRPEHVKPRLLGQADGLETASGLAGLSGTSGDRREVLAAAGGGDHRALLALEVYLHRLRREVAAMGGLDVLVFTGGVGEHLPGVRAAAAEGLQFLGIVLDAGRNAATTGDGEIGADGAPVRTAVVTSREDVEIAGQVRHLLGG